mgnify:CR=1 FL=1
MRRGWCPTGKRRYRKRHHAERALATIRATSTRERLPVRVYACPRCGGGWHLTSDG